MGTDEQASDLLLLLPELARRLRPRPPRDSPASSLSLAQIKAMTHLAQHGEEKMSELARGLDISLPAATDLVDRLAAGGHVERVRDERDRRIVLVRLSPAAQARIAPILARRRRAVEETLRALDERERAAFIKGLHLLAQHLADDACPPRTEEHGGTP
ncbi:MAG: MarR family transcriptional regulator [Chloroflexi bacterium]|nr:MarR family transcriptional regulator [Chloroflexota bacterium]GIW11398.1 MAG: MarR family transcriptional regulator [Dehalococcoidia bacterium]